MKQTFMGLAVIAIALAAAAFTTPKEKGFTNYFFRVDAEGKTLNSTGVPPTSNFSECTNIGTNNCAQSYGGYTLISPGVYGPVGTDSAIIKKP